jgi:hypothetical protein
MPTRRSRAGDASASERKHVGMTLPRRVKDHAKRAAEVLDWSVGDWLLAMAAEHGPELTEALGHVEVRRRPSVEDATFTAIYLTPDERDELDDQAVAARLNRSAFVTAVARLGLGEPLEAVVAPLRTASTAGGSTSDGAGSSEPADRNTAAEETAGAAGTADGRGEKA